MVILKLARHQKNMGYQVSILTTNQPFKDRLALEGLNSVEIDCIRRGYNIFFDIFGVVKLVRYLQANEYDIVHTHTSKAGLVGRLAAWLTGKSIVLHTVHGFPFSENSSKIKIWILSLLEKICAGLSDKVIFVSKYHLQWAKKLGIITNDSLGIAIPNGVKEKSTKGGPILSPPSSTNLVYFGRLVKEKGIFDLVQSFKIVHEKFPRLSLKVIGDGPEFRAMKGLERDIPNIKVLGFKADVETEIEERDIFILPSYREGLSISAIEAQSMGLASVLSDVGGNLELSDSGKAALIYSVGDIGELAERIVQLLKDARLHSNIKKQAKSNFFSCYTESKMLENYDYVYEAVLSEKGVN